MGGPCPREEGVDAANLLRSLWASGDDVARTGSEQLEAGEPQAFEDLGGQ